MAWDPAARANLFRLHNQGLVAVRYEAHGCNVELEVLSNCIGPAKYDYAPYAANDTKMARTAGELYAQLPIGAARLGGMLKGSRALRTDYMLVGTASVPAGSSFARDALKGDCSRATHVVSTIYVGGFAMAAGESQALHTSASLFQSEAGAKRESAVERLQNEGDAEACRTAQREGKASPLCAVPLRIALIALAGTPVPPPAPAMAMNAPPVEKESFTAPAPDRAARVPEAKPGEPVPATAAANPDGFTASFSSGYYSSSDVGTGPGVNVTAGYTGKYFDVPIGSPAPTDASATS